MGVRIGNPYAFAMNDPWMRKPDEQRARIERLIGSKLNFNQSLPGQAGGKPLNPIAMNYDRRAIWRLTRPMVYGESSLP